MNVLKLFLLFTFSILGVGAVNNQKINSAFTDVPNYAKFDPADDRVSTVESYSLPLAAQKAVLYIVELNCQQSLNEITADDICKYFNEYVCSYLFYEPKSLAKCLQPGQINEQKSTKVLELTFAGSSHGRGRAVVQDSLLIFIFYLCQEADLDSEILKNFLKYESLFIK